MKVAYGKYLLKVYETFTQSKFIDFCGKFEEILGSEEVSYAMGMVGFDGAMFEPLSNQSLKDWILQDDELGAMG